MASRFTDTELWNEDWFCEMPGEYQLFVKYVFDKCDNAGVWKPNKFDFETKTKFKVSPDLLFKKMNAGGGGYERVLLLENGRWFLTGYLLFQWFNKKKNFDLVLSNKLHKSLYTILLENKVDFKKVRGLREVLETSKVMVMEMVMEKKDSDRGMGKEEGEVGLSQNGFWCNKLPKDMRLTNMQIGVIIEFINLKCKKQIDQGEVRSQWEAFKIQQFEQRIWKNSIQDLLSHFRNSLKFQFEKNGNQKSDNRPSKTSGLELAINRAMADSNDRRD